MFPKVKDFAKEKDLEQLIAGRKRDNAPSSSPAPEPKPRKESQPNDPKTEAIVKAGIKKIDKILNIPIHEVVKVQNDSEAVSRANNPNSTHNPNKGFINYKKLAEEARANTLTQRGSDGYKALTSAYAEAIVFKNFRDPRARDGFPVGVAVYEPVDRLNSRGLTNLIPDADIRNLATQTPAKIGNKTPDILFISSTRTYKIADKKITYTPALINVVKPTNPNSNGEYEVFNGTLISPIEVTTSKNLKSIEEKIEKFKTYRSTNANTTSFHYVPVLVIDRGVYEGFSNDKKAELLQGMNAVGGRIMLYKDLIKKSEKLAGITAEVLTQDVQSSKHRKSASLDSDNTSEVATTNSTLTSSQPTPSRGETPAVAAIDEAKLQAILARMQARQQAGTSNNPVATTFDDRQNRSQKPQLATITPTDTEVTTPNSTQTDTKPSGVPAYIGTIATTTTTTVPAYTGTIVNPNNQINPNATFVAVGKITENAPPQQSENSLAQGHSA